MRVPGSCLRSTEASAVLVALTEKGSLMQHNMRAALCTCKIAPVTALQAPPGPLKSHVRVRAELDGRVERSLACNNGM